MQASMIVHNLIHIGDTKTARLNTYQYKTQGSKKTRLWNTARSRIRLTRDFRWYQVQVGVLITDEFCLSYVMIIGTHLAHVGVAFIAKRHRQLQ